MKVTLDDCEFQEFIEDAKEVCLVQRTVAQSISDCFPWINVYPQRLDIKFH